MLQTQEKIHIDVTLSPEERHRVVLELEEARARFHADKMNYLTKVLEQLLEAFRVPRQPIPLEPMPDGAPDQVVADFRSEGRYSDAFLDSLERGLKRLAADT